MGQYQQFRCRVKPLKSLKNTGAFSLSSRPATLPLPNLRETLLSTHGDFAAAFKGSAGLQTLIVRD
jgi:hypothetical protein